MNSNNNLPTNTPTIPIKQISAKKFIPLVVGSKFFDIKIQAKLFEDQKLQSFIQEILNQFDTIKDKNSSLYAIRQCSSNQYINEKNRSDLLIINDQFKFHEVELCFNLETEVRNFIDKISPVKLTNSTQLIDQLKQIKKYISSDRIFAFEFFAKGGKKLIIDYIKECDKTSDSNKWNLLYHFYRLLFLLIKNWMLISWDISDIDILIVKLLCETLNDSTKENKKHIIPDNLVLLYLQIADDIINNSLSTRDLMIKDLKFYDIIFVIQRQDVKIKEALLVFLNSCYKKGDSNFKNNLNSILIQPLMSAVLREGLRLLKNSNSLNADNAASQQLSDQNLLMSRRLSNNSIDSTNLSKIKTKLRFRKNNKNQHNTFYNDACKDERNIQNIFYNFALLQKNILDIDFGNRMKTPVDKDQMSKIKLILNNAFEQFNLGVTEKVLSEEDKLSKLGFINTSNPIEDLKDSSFGIITLDFMEYFAGNNRLKTILQNFVCEKFNKNSDYAFPFVKASIHMVKYLCGLLNIGEENGLNKDNEILFIMFTINTDGIFEFFSKCLWLFQKLWIEMKAQSLDFDRALSALKDSLYKILMDTNKIDSSNISHFNSVSYSSLIKHKLNELNNFIDTWKYDYIKNIKNRFDKFNLAPVKELEKILTKEVIDMVRPKRLSILCKGENFFKLDNLREKKSRQNQFWKLSSDYKTFHISESDNQSETKSTNTIDVERIKDVKREDPRRQTYFLNIVCMRLDEQGEENIILANTNEETIEAWLEGINILINPKPTPNITCFVECLIDVQLLDLHTLNYEIPHDIPKVPSLPGFDFNIVSN